MFNPISKKLSLSILEKTFGANHPKVAQSLNNLVQSYKDSSDYESLEPLLLRAIEMGEKTHGPDHPDVATALNDLAELYRNKENFRSGGIPAGSVAGYSAKVTGTGSSRRGDDPQ